MTKKLKKTIKKIDHLNYFQLIQNRVTLSGKKEEIIAELMDKESGKIIGDKLNEIIDYLNTK